MRTATKRMVGLGLLAAAGYAVWRAFEARRVDTGVTWQPQPFPYPPVPRDEHPADEAVDGAPVDPPTATGWLEPVDGTCPATHPVKAKLASGIFHVPGGAAYERTNADRCYPTADAAAADGLRAAKV